jgi:hypothetical protein
MILEQGNLEYVNLDTMVDYCSKHKDCYIVSFTKRDLEAQITRVQIVGTTYGYQYSYSIGCRTLYTDMPFAESIYLYTNADLNNNKTPYIEVDSLKRGESSFLCLTKRGAMECIRQFIILKMLEKETEKEKILFYKFYKRIKFMLHFVIGNPLVIKLNNERTTYYR